MYITQGRATTFTEDRLSNITPVSHHWLLHEYEALWWSGVEAADYSKNRIKLAGEEGCTSEMLKKKTTFLRSHVSSRPSARLNVVSQTHPPPLRSITAVITGDGGANPKA